MKIESINKHFQQLLKKYPICNIENAFVQKFLETNNINVKNNILILEIYNDNSQLTNNRRKYFWC